MPRKSPPVIYTCISEPDEDGDVVIRYSADPTALDSLPTMANPPRKLVSKSPVAFVYVWNAQTGDFGSTRMSCRGRTFDGRPGTIIDSTSVAMNWLIDDDITSGCT